MKCVPGINEESVFSSNSGERIVMKKSRVLISSEFESINLNLVGICEILLLFESR